MLIVDAEQKHLDEPGQLTHALYSTRAAPIFICHSDDELLSSLTLTDRFSLLNLGPCFTKLQITVAPFSRKLLTKKTNCSLFQYTIPPLVPTPTWIFSTNDESISGSAGDLDNIILMDQSPAEPQKECA
ncbi:unnamed protein product [Schistocephalus solidus]|uniref:Uncharacterized protein n=1 Tax=Schistocephalus solidus TaxID=70667 RepID=A0A3P7EP66_SCHSO|nr:unnamed protein product [Schistocephalus solidus]